MYQTQTQTKFEFSMIQKKLVFIYNSSIYSKHRRKNLVIILK